MSSIGAVVLNLAESLAVSVRRATLALRRVMRWNTDAGGSGG